MNKLFKKLFLLFFPLGFIVIAVNYFIDPANLFSIEKYEQEIAKILISGNNVDNISNYDERLLQKEILLKTKSKVDIYVLGSSRIMEISNSFFSNKKLINLGVSHANIFDLIALTGLIDSLKVYPNEVIINLDPFLICEGGTIEWQSLSEYYEYFNKNHCKSKNQINGTYNYTFKKYYSLVSFEYFKKSMEFLIKNNSKVILNVGKRKPKKYGRYIDGSIAYSQSYQNPDTILVSKVSIGTAKQKLGNLDMIKIDLLKDLINFYQKKNIKITLLMLPFQEDYFETVNKTQDNIFNMYDSSFYSIANKMNTKLYGSFNPKFWNIKRSDFYDPYHCSGISIKRNLNKFYFNN